MTPFHQWWHQAAQKPSTSASTRSRQSCLPGQQTIHFWVEKSRKPANKFLPMEESLDPNTFQVIASHSQSWASQLIFRVIILPSMHKIPRIWVHFGTFPSEFGASRSPESSHLLDIPYFLFGWMQKNYWCSLPVATHTTCFTLHVDATNKNWRVERKDIILHPLLMDIK